MEKLNKYYQIMNNLATFNGLRVADVMEIAKAVQEAGQELIKASQNDRPDAS